MTCTSCHNMPTTSTGQHSKHMGFSGVTCATCHSGIATGSTTTAAIVGPALHVNGTKDLAFSGTYSGRAVSMTVTRSGTSVSCSGSCHSSKTW